MSKQPEDRTPQSEEEFIHPEATSFDQPSGGTEEPASGNPGNHQAAGPFEDAEAAGSDLGSQAVGGPPTAAEIDALRAELAAAEQRILRTHAELENYRKRTQRNLEEERRFAPLPLLRDLLGVVDNLQRAIDAAQQNEAAGGLLQGVEMVADQLRDVLKKHHCEEIPALGETFDPNLHEAIAQLPSEQFEPGKVAQVTQVGYQAHGRVIRPSQVIVAAPRTEKSGGDA